METQASEQERETPVGQGRQSDEADQPATAANGTASDHGLNAQDTPHQYVGRRVTPSTAKLDETPEERAERKRHLKAVLESLRAKTTDEAEEQRETLKMLDAALSRGRPYYEKLFPDADE